MKQRPFVAFAMTLVLAASTTAMAHDLFAPSWRGQPGSTMQAWSFDTDANPAAPDLINNPYGSATATVTVGMFGSGWQSQLPGFGEQTGYWDIGDIAVGPQIVLDIPNNPVALEYKEIWVQVTAWEDISQAPIVDVPGAMFLGSEQMVLESVPTGGNWVLNLSKWRIEPNPNQEQVILSAVPMFGAVIDHVVVDTICVPEPATILALLAGGIAAVARRRRVGC